MAQDDAWPAGVHPFPSVTQPEEQRVCVPPDPGHGCVLVHVAVVAKGQHTRARLGLGEEIAGPADTRTLVGEGSNLMTLEAVDEDQAGGGGEDRQGQQLFP